MVLKNYNTILITGGNGFIGKNLVNFFKQKDNNLNLIALDVNKPQNKIPQIEYIQKDINDYDFAEIFKERRIDVLVHLAGIADVVQSIKNPIQDLKINCELTLKILESIRKYSPKTKFFFSSSAAVYGNPKRLPIKENSIINPITPYGVSKACSEYYIKVYHKLHNVKSVICRTFSAYGKFQQKLVIYDLIRKMLDGSTRIQLRGTGEETRDFINIVDLCNAFYCIIENSPFESNVYNLGSGNETKIIDLAHMIKNNFDEDIEILTNDNVEQGKPVRWVADIGEIKKLGFSPMVNLRDGIKNYIKMLRNET